MAYSTGGRGLYLFAQLRRIATTAAATAIGAFNLVTKAPETRIELKPGDRLPTFRCRDLMAGSIV